MKSESHSDSVSDAERLNITVLLFSATGQFVQMVKRHEPDTNTILQEE